MYFLYRTKVFTFVYLQIIFKSKYNLNMHIPKKLWTFLCYKLKYSIIQYISHINNLTTKICTNCKNEPLSQVFKNVLPKQR